LVRAHERSISAFLVPARAARFKTTIGSEKGREKVRARLPHHARDFDPRYATKLSSSLSVRDIEKLLRDAGAPTRCYVLSEDMDIDGRILDLGEALGSVAFAYGAGLISCIPGRLGLFSDEAPDGQWLLRRTAEPRRLKRRARPV
jgi:hypothetical protein